MTVPVLNPQQKNIEPENEDKYAEFGAFSERR